MLSVLIIFLLLYTIDLISNYHAQHSINTIKEYIKFSQIYEEVKKNNINDLNQVMVKLNDEYYKMKFKEYFLYYNWYFYYKINNQKRKLITE